MPVQGKVRMEGFGAPRGPWWKQRRARIAGVVLLGLAVVGLAGWLVFLRPYVITDDARVAATMVRLAPEGVTGRVTRVAVSEGDRVSAGQVLIELDHRMAEAQLARAIAQAGKARGDSARLVEYAKAQGVTGRDLDDAHAATSVSEAELRLAQIAVDRTYIKSPLNGIVVQKVVEVGNILEAGQTALALADVEHAWVAANVEETRVSRVRVGQKAYISVDEGGTLTGRVLEVRAAAASQFALIPSDNAAGNFIKVVQRIPVKIALDPHPGRVLRVGESVVVRILVR
jgi:membrane fusion protein (multidrug efflux system)